MTRSICTPVAVAIVLLASLAAAAAETSPPTTFVRGFRGDPKGGFVVPWYTHLGSMPLYGVRQRKEMDQMEWRSAPLPAQIPTETVTFVWTGAMGAMAPGGGFTISVNGHAAAECNVAPVSTQFPARKNCRCSATCSIRSTWWTPRGTSTSRCRRPGSSPASPRPFSQRRR